MRIEAQIKHAERKREKAEQELHRLVQTESEQKAKLQGYERDLETVKRAANQAQGASLERGCGRRLTVARQRRRGGRRRTTWL